MPESKAPGRVSRRSGLPFQRMGDEILVVDPKARKAHVLKGAAVRIWDLLEKPSAPPDIARALSAEFDVDEDRARRDAEKFLAEIEALGLLERAPSGA